MPAKEQRRNEDKRTATRRSGTPVAQDPATPLWQMHPATLVQQARHDPGSMEPRDVLQLQSVTGNLSLGRLLARSVLFQAPQTGPLVGSYTTTLASAVVQRVPLFEGSAIDHDAATGSLTFGGVSKDIDAADLGTLRNAITIMLGEGEGPGLDHGVDRGSIEKLLRKYFGGEHGTLGFSLVAKQWNQMADHMLIMDARRQADEARLRTSRLLDAGDTFDSYELTGADPHKGGEATLMLRYTTAVGQIKRIVYKPADLTPERVIYGGDTFRVEQFGGTYAEPEAGGVTGVYGYMTFLQESGPRTPADVANLYSSFGEALALAYVYGLKDLHWENYILSRDRIQWIDLEAMTGTFTTWTAADLTAKVFQAIANKMLDALKESIEPGQAQWFKDWRRRKNRADLAARLAAIDAAARIRAGFVAKQESIPATAPEAATWATRFVPFLTAHLYPLVNAWHDKPELDADPFPPADWAGGHEPDWYISHMETLRSTYGGNAEGVDRGEVDRMMNARATRAAIRRGDIPFFIRQGNSICDEAGHVIVPASTHPRLQSEEDIGTGIEERRTGEVPAALDWALSEARTYHAVLCDALSQDWPSVPWLPAEV